MQVTKDSVDIGVHVRDIDAMLAFYCDALGLPKDGEVTFPGGRTQHRIKIGSALLKLMEHEQDAPPAGPKGMRAQSGIRYFTISIRDLDGTVRDLEAKGLSFVVPPREARPGVWIAMVEDPEGNTVELLEQR
jgi:catechol 2,3-dioxygenase-like lactoylglutathione lyase family enzyme